jgi:glycosyltransferase involved in cell wall biosynthesis
MVVGLSKDLIEMAHAVTPIEHKARIVYNSVQLPESAWTPRQKRAPFKIGCAGIFKYAKGLPYLFKAVSIVAKRHDVVVELVGSLRESEKAAYEIMVERTGVTDILRFREPLPHHEVTDWLRSLDLFVLPSVTEGCPNILMEAMAIGAPCVATRTGAVEFLVEDGVSGILARWGDSAALADAIIKMITDREMAEAMGRRARERMIEFSPEAEKRAWKQVYHDVLQT